MLAFLVVGIMGSSPFAVTPSGTGEAWHGFSFWTDTHYSAMERFMLILNVIIAFAGLGYALMLVKEVYGSDQGTSRMQEIAQAVREGANAYLRRQLTTVSILIILITGVLIWTKWPAADDPHLEKHKAIAWGRGIAFLIGSIFSATVGFVGMRLATAGNLRVAAAARESFGKALQIGYRTGTITGMLTDGLGLLGGSIIFLYYGEQAYEALMGFGFGGTLLALFMRVGGGIYTKAADVGADLVGKVEAGIPEDDPRNAATIADNVGDNVGDCAGMAADIFESYEVTIVAAMILGYATFGHKGVIFPLLIRAIGVVGSIISTYSVKTGDRGDVASAMKAVERGFIIGSIISVVGFIILGFFYFRFTTDYPNYDRIRLYVENQPWWVCFWFNNSAPDSWGILDMRPAWTCLIGIVLAVALNKCTEYWTGTEYEPVKSCAKSCRTGHATNIIQGIAVGYESTVWAVIIIAAAIFGSVVIYSNTNPMFVAYGVAMCGIGLLTLTGNTISMDVFGPVADNANGIGEMGYNKDSNNRELNPGDPGYMNPEDYKRARQILSDLDAVGNTTKAITKGIAIGSAVIAAVSLFASFIAVMATGSEEGINKLTTADFMKGAAHLTVADPYVFIGLLIGGAVPFLFSSMTIRAVGRAAYLIVQECRVQFRDKEIWAGTKKPDYGRVVDICTATAQRELIGPGLLAIFAPILVGFAMGPYALGGYLAGMIIVGQLLAVFMANAGGAWDNAKKTVEDQPKTALTGKGSETHKASVTGDTVGDPLKDTAGPAINPLIKVMNMVSLLALTMVIPYNLSTGETTFELKNDTKVTGAIVDSSGDQYIVSVQDKKTSETKPVTVKRSEIKSQSRTWGSLLIGLAVLLVSLAAIGWAWWQSKSESAEMRAMDEEFERAAASAGAGGVADHRQQHVGMH